MKQLQMAMFSWLSVGWTMDNPRKEDWNKVGARNMFVSNFVSKWMVRCQTGHYFEIYSKDVFMDSQGEITIFVWFYTDEVLTTIEDGKG